MEDPNIATITRKAKATGMLWDSRNFTDISFTAANGAASPWSSFVRTRNWHPSVERKVVDNANRYCRSSQHAIEEKHANLHPALISHICRDLICCC